MKAFTFAFDMIHSDERISEHLAVIAINAARQTYLNKIDPSPLLDTLMNIQPKLKNECIKIKKQLGENKTATVSVGIDGDGADAFFDIIFEYWYQVYLLFENVPSFHHVIAALFSISIDLIWMRRGFNTHDTKDFVEMNVSIDGIIQRGNNGYHKCLLYLEEHLFTYLLHFFKIFPNKLKYTVARSKYDFGGVNTALEGTERLNSLCKGHGKHNNKQGNYLQTPHERVVIVTHGAPKRNLFDPNKTRKKSEKKKKKRKPWSVINSTIQSVLNKFPTAMREKIEQMNKITANDSISENLIDKVAEYNKAKKINKTKSGEKIEFDLTETAVELAANDENITQKK
eukprot:66852_1